MLRSFPLSLVPIIANEFCERWAFYSIRAVLALYCVDRLGYSADGAVALYSFWTAASYLSPFCGGYVADALLGKYKTILIFTAVYLSGMALLAAASAPTPSSAGGSLAGLALIALGTGGIKPCVSTFGMDQLAGAGPNEITRFFLLFYFSINAGSLLSYVVTPIVRAEVSFGAAFALSAAVLVAAFAAFLAGTPLYVRLPAAGNSVYAQFARVFAASWRAGCGRRRAGVEQRAPLMAAAAAAAAAVAAAVDGKLGAAVEPAADAAPPLPPPLTTGLRWADAALGTVPAAEVFGVATVARLSPLILLLAPFWALFDAQGSIWTLQRVGMRTFCFAGGSGCLTTEQLGALNPLLVLVFVPLIGWLCEVLRARVARGAAPAWLEPTPLRRMSAGMLLTPVSFALTAAVQAAIDAAPAGTVSILWQVPQHVAITVAEVLVSATGLEWANKEAPASMTTSVVALYLGTVALGNVITGVLYSSLAGVLSSVQLILLLMALMCAAAGAFVALAATYVSLPAPAAAAAPSDDAGAAGEATSLLLTEAKGGASRQL